MTKFATTALELITCCKAGCGVQFGVSDAWIRNRRNDHALFYCPNGHSQYFPQKSDLDCAKEDRDRLAAERLRLQAEVDYQREQKRKAQAEVSTQKGRATRFKNERDKVKTRIAKGVCTECHRSFVNVQRHYETCHTGPKHG